jgi:hypothetical protein
VRLLSGYRYLALFSSVAARFFHLAKARNLEYLIGSDCGKLALLAAVCYQVLARQLMLCLTVVALLGMLPVILTHELHLVATLSRVLQCTVLTGVGLLYLDQFSSSIPLFPASWRDKNQLPLFRHSQPLPATPTVALTLHIPKRYHCAS